MNKQKIYVGNLPYRTDDQELQETFAQFGEIEEAVVIRYRKSGRSKGYGFVTFTTEDAAENALKLDGEELQGRRMFVKIAHQEETQQDEFVNEHHDS